MEPNPHARQQLVVTSMTWPLPPKQFHTGWFHSGMLAAQTVGAPIQMLHLETKTFVEAVELTIKMITAATIMDAPAYGSPGTNVVNACGLKLGNASVNPRIIKLPRVWFLGACIPA